MRIAIIIAALAVTSPAMARDDGRYATSPLKAWFEKLKKPGTDISCCNVSDCKRTEMEMKGSYYRARLPSGRWVDIPDTIVVHDQGNPTGEPILCAMEWVTNVTPGYKLYCFVPGGGL